MANIMRCSRSYQRLVLRCVLAAILVVAILCFGCTWPPAANAESSPDIQLSERDLPNPQERLVTNQVTAKQTAAQDPVEPHVNNDSPSPPQTQAKENAVAASEQQISQTIHQIEDFFDDEYRLKALLSPITETGEPLLRDLTHRVRAFRKVFQIWEDLHLVHRDDQVHPQSITPRLRSTKAPSQIIAQTIRTYDRIRFLVNTFAKRLFPWTMLAHPDHMSLHASFYNGGRGIVFTAGNPQAPELLTVIPSLRRLGCKLPIEIMYLGDEDLDEDMRDRLEKLDDVTTRDLRLMVDDFGWHLAGWAAKAFAILMSSFREAIFIDADSFFFVDPSTLFDDEGYRTTGALFFKDRNVSPENKRAWIKSILPTPISAKVKQNRMWTGESGHMQESGVIVVDKWRHFISMLLTTRLNGPDRDSDEAKGKKGVYDMMYGDKETFWLSWEMAGDTSYSFHSGVAGTMGKLTAVQPADPEKPEEEPKPVDGPMICSPQLIHFDTSGKPLWFNGWLSVTKDDLKQWQEFDVYLEEKQELGRKPEKDAWAIHPANVVCLEAAEGKKFDAKDRETLDGILKLAKENSALLNSS